MDDVSRWSDQIKKHSSDTLQLTSPADHLKRKYDQKQVNQYPVGVHRWLCDTLIPEEDKLEFVNDVLAHTNNRHIPFVAHEPCDCLNEAPALRKVLINHYRRQTSSSYEPERYAYILFALANQLPDADSLLNDYFKTWQKLPNYIRFHPELPKVLNKTGRREAVIQLLDLSLDEWPTSSEEPYFLYDAYRCTKLITELAFVAGGKFRSAAI
ncbi:MAG: hypothetical protein AAGJ82_12245, partial [Bacteroidota bacterium]